MLVSPARRRIGLDIEVLRLPPLSTLFALEDNQSSASARTHQPKPERTSHDRRRPFRRVFQPHYRFETRPPHQPAPLITHSEAYDTHH